MAREWPSVTPGSRRSTQKSSPEAELVGVDDTLGYILWAGYFMIEQGYDMDRSLFYQDNMGAILLEINGKASSSKKSKHF